jgi:hypothetical protein
MKMVTCRLVLLLASTVLPFGAYADETWKWTDGAGRPAYSNVKDRVPPSAKIISTDLGFIGGLMEGAAEDKAGSERRLAPAAADTVRAETQRHRRLAARLADVARAADVFPTWPAYSLLWRDYQADDPIGTQIWLYNAETILQLRRWGLGS